MKVIKRRVTHYVKNDDLLREILKSKANGKPSRELIEMCRLIASRLITKLYFKDPMDRDDVLMGGWTDMVLYYHKFNPEVSTNAFAYMTQTCKNGFGKNWNKMYKKRKDFNVMHVSISQGNIYSI